MALQKALLSGVLCVVDSSAPTVPLTDLTGDGGDLAAHNADVLRGINSVITSDGTHAYLAGDSRRIYLGAGNDAYIEFDGTNLIVKPNAVGSGRVMVDGLISAAPPSIGAALVSRDYVLSRGMNLVTNGSGLLASNYNFSGHVFDTVETHGGGGSFKHTGAYRVSYSDELLPVDPEKFYRLACWVKSGDTGGGNFNSANRQGFGFAPYDIDGASISPVHWTRHTGATDTTLAAALTPGDTALVLTDATGWNNNANYYYSRNFTWWPYTNSKGYTYPDYTYTRNLSDSYASNASLGAWNAGAISGNTITLRVPWAGPALAAGTKVRNHTSGGSFLYVFSQTIIPNAWTNYVGTTGGFNTTADVGIANQFPYGTAYVKLVFLNNQSGGTSPTNIVRWSDIWMSELSAKNIASGAKTEDVVIGTVTLHFVNGMYTGKN